MKKARSKEMFLIHCTQVSKSGAAKYVDELFRAVRKVEPSTHLVCPRNFEHAHSHPHENLSLFREMDGKRTGGKVRSMAFQSSEATRCIKDLALKAEGQKVIVHFNFPGLPFFVLYQFKKIKSYGLELALTVHDVIPHRWLLPRSLNIIERWFLRSMYQCADALFVHHKSQAETLVKEFGVDEDRITVVHHGVFSLSQEPLRYKDCNQFTALCFGAIRENKGIAEAIEAVQLLRSGGSPIKLIIAGAASQGESEYWTQCKEKISKRPDGIEVVEGYIPDSDVKGYFERSSFVLLPYSDFFSQSGVATMALSSGRAIVSTDSGGLSEMLVTGRYGVRISNSSAEAVSVALQEAMQLGHPRLKEMGEAAFEYFRLNYSWDAAAKIQINVCRRLAEV